MNELLEFIKKIEKEFGEVKAKAIRVDGKVVLHEGKFEQERKGLDL
jgi:predicted solute-binding protein